MRPIRMMLVTLFASLTVLPAVRATTLHETGAIQPDVVEPFSSFGESLAVHGDRLLVGASWYDAPVGRGAAFLFDADTGEQLAELFPDAHGRHFGLSVAVSDSYLVVGDPWDEEGGHPKGALYIFDAATGAFERKILAVNTTFLGTSVAIDGNIVVASGYQGVFAYDASTGQLIQEFPLNIIGPTFIAIEGDTVLLGDPTNSGLGLPSAGAVYSLDLSSGYYSFIFSEEPASFAHFGVAVAIDEDRAIIAAGGRDGYQPGFVYIFDLESHSQIARLENPSPTWDAFGVDVALSGNLAVVGSWWYDGPETDSGTAYAFHWPSETVIAQLEASAGLEDQKVGWRVATRGTQVLVSSKTMGVVYEFELPPPKVVAADGAASDFFGLASAIGSKAAIIGAPNDDDLGANSGSAYLVEPATGSEIHKLLPSDGSAGAEFGRAVAIDDGIAIVGAPFDGSAGPYSGAAYLFDVDTGVEIAKLVASDGDPYDYFGVTVAIHGNVAIVGAYGDDDRGYQAGAAYLFDTTTGAQVGKLLADDGDDSDNFGFYVGIYGNTAVVAATRDDDQALNSGAVYLFDAATGVQTQKLVAADGDESDRFGVRLAIHGDVIVIGATGDDDNGTDSGSAYLFDATSGQQIAKLLATDGAAGDLFGNSVAIHGDDVVIGSPLHDVDTGTTLVDAGCAYVFDVATGLQVGKLQAPDARASDWFGWSVGLHDGTTIVGSMKDDDAGNNSGSAYIYGALPPAE